MCKKASCVVILSLALSCMLIASAGADITTGLVGYWPLNGNAQDTGGTGLHGTEVGNPTYVDGAIEQALGLDGDGDYVTCPDNALFDITDTITVAAWIKVNTFDKTWQYVVGKGDSAWRLVRENATNNFRWRANGPTPTLAVVGNVNVNDGQWHHVAGTYDGSTAILYIDGTANASLKCSGAISKTAYSVWIGQCSQQKNRAWNGLIDDVRVYRRALTAADVTELLTFAPSPRTKASQPQPANGAVGVSIPLLQWKPGLTALLHKVYVGTKPELGIADLVAPNLAEPVYYYAASLLPGTTYYWRVDEVEADMKTIHTGDVWSFITQALTAYSPKPANGDGNVSSAVTLTWQPGKNALRHRVYLSGSLDAVTKATAEADKGEQKEATFTPTGLQEATTYYWRVDEVLVDGTIQAGPVWSFATFLTVDDFEAYTDEEGKRIYETWIDGWTNSTSSTVGYIQAPFAEQKIIHGGKQSMPLDYNNTKAPFYSEAEREFAGVQDWTVGNANTLVLYVQGRSSNGQGKLYVAVEDSAKHIGVVSQADAAVVTQAKWTEWKIPFSDFTAAGVNLARVKKLYVGVGERKNPTAGSRVLIYIDDIRAIKPATP
jgi:hypothetical protein